MKFHINKKKNKTSEKSKCKIYFFSVLIAEFPLIDIDGLKQKLQACFVRFLQSAEK